MGFLPPLYAAMFFIVATAGYLISKSFVKYQPAARGVFLAVLGFGACSYVGFIVILLAAGNTPLKVLFDAPYQPFFYSAAYFVPGFIGAWLAFRLRKQA